MSLRRFDGDEPALVHEHYDVDGNLTGTTIVRPDPEWDEQSRTWALALTMREAGECRRCGGDLAETLDYDFKWLPEPPAVCLRCVALQADEKTHAKNPQHTAMIHRVRKVPRPKPKSKPKKGR